MTNGGRWKEPWDRRPPRISSTAWPTCRASIAAAPEQRTKKRAMRAFATVPCQHRAVALPGLHHRRARGEVEEETHDTMRPLAAAPCQHCTAALPGLHHRRALSASSIMLWPWVKVAHWGCADLGTRWGRDIAGLLDVLFWCVGGPQL